MVKVMRSDYIIYTRLQIHRPERERDFLLVLKIPTAMDERPVRG
jgi:hypothetical protein